MEIGNQAVSRTFSGSSTGIGMAISPATPDESPSKIRDAVSYAEQLLGDLHGSLSHLESRLDTALTPQPPTTANPDRDGAAMPISSPLLQRLGVVNEALGVAISRVSLLRQRVEV